MNVDDKSIFVFFFRGGDKLVKLAYPTFIHVTGILATGRFANADETLSVATISLHLVEIW